MSLTAENIFIFIKHSQNKQAKALLPLIDNLQNFLDLNPSSPTNTTLLHCCANNNNYDMARYVIDLYNRSMSESMIKLGQQKEGKSDHMQQTGNNERKYTQQSRKAWVRQQDGQGFTCLHYAVFRSNYKMVKLFEQFGADIFQVNGQGLNAMHIAAQADSPLLIVTYTVIQYYFLTKGITINSVDNKGNTALHWACYSGMENAVFSLISWGADIEQKQANFGMTPLHLAVLSGNGRIVRKLLIKGCNRNIPTLTHKLPLDLATQAQFTNISQMLQQSSPLSSLSQLCTLKTPYRKQSRFSPSFYMLIFLFASSFVLNIVSFCLCESQIYQKGLYIVFFAIGGLEIGVFAAVCVTDPGAIGSRGDRHQAMLELLGKNRANKICYDCGIVKPQRSRHCEICQTCISVYDHHCPWIANCIGCKNFAIFYTFLLIMLILLIQTMVLQISSTMCCQCRSYLTKLDKNS